MKVLVIDDDEISREALCEELRASGIQTVDLPSPIGATRLLRTERIDAVVIDIMMPAIRGDRLAKLLRGNPKFSTLGVVLVSGDTSVRLRELADSVGADAVVSKKGIRGHLGRAVVSAARARSSQRVRE